MIHPDTGRWAAGIGDPTLMGWVTVVVYMVVAAQCAGNAWLARPVRREHGMWVLIAALVFCLGINKQLDLQTWFTQTARDVAMAGGWYETRRPLQAGFIAGLATGAVGVFFLFAWLMRDQWSRYRYVAGGLVALCCFVVARAATFHHVDVMLGAGVGFLRLNHVFELGALAAVSYGAVRWLRSSRIPMLRHALGTADEDGRRVGERRAGDRRSAARDRRV